jgi:hypothetical protein
MPLSVYDDIKFVHTYVLTYLLTPWSRVLIEKITCWQPVKKFPAFLEPEGSSPRLQDLPPVPVLSQINPVHAPHPNSWRSFLILSYHLRLSLPSVLFPSGVPTKTLYSSILNHNYCHIRRLNNVQTWPIYQNFVGTVQPGRKIHINFSFVLGSDATWIGFLPTFKREMMFLFSRSKYVEWDYTLILRTSNIIMEAGSSETSEARHTSTHVPDPKLDRH